MGVREGGRGPYILKATEGSEESFTGGGGG